MAEVHKLPKQNPPAPIANIEAEQALIGAVLLDNSVLDRIPSSFSSEMFYEPAHGRIYDLASLMVSEGRELTPVVAKTYLAADEAITKLGGPGYLTRMAGAALVPSLAPDYARLVKGLWARREAISAAEAAADMLRDTSDDKTAEEAIEAAQTSFANVAGAVAPKAVMSSMSSALTLAAERTNTAYLNDGRPLCSTGLPQLDRVTGGLMPADHWVIMAESSMGKTAVAGEIADSVVKQGKAVFIGSLEMPAEQLAFRMISSTLAGRGHRIEYNRMMSGNLTEEEFRLQLEISREMESYPVQFAEDDTAALHKLMAAAHACRRKYAATKTPLGLVLVDYLQLVNVVGVKGATEIVGAAAKGMKTLAKGLGVPVVSLSQMNRENRHRENKRPTASDARQSAEIEQSADVMIGLYREAYYIDRDLQGMKAGDSGYSEKIAELEVCKNELEMIILKNRRGPLNKLRAWIDLPVNRLCPVAPGNPDQEEFL